MAGILRRMLHHLNTTVPTYVTTSDTRIREQRLSSAVVKRCSKGHAIMVLHFYAGRCDLATLRKIALQPLRIAMPRPPMRLGNNRLLSVTDNRGVGKFLHFPCPFSLLTSGCEHSRL